MENKIYGYLLALLLFGLFLHTGCAGYGSARYQWQIQGNLPQLMDHFRDYHVYYPGMSEAFPSGSNR